MKKKYEPVIEDEFDDIPEDTRYFITPKGIASLCLLQSGLITDFDDPRFEGFWKLFEQDMRHAGYIADDDEEGGESK